MAGLQYVMEVSIGFWSSLCMYHLLFWPDSFGTSHCQSFFGLFAIRNPCLRPFVLPWVHLELPCLLGSWDALSMWRCLSLPRFHPATPTSPTTTCPWAPASGWPLPELSTAFLCMREAPAMNAWRVARSTTMTLETFRTMYLPSIWLFGSTAALDVAAASPGALSSGHMSSYVGCSLIRSTGYGWLRFGWLMLGVLLLPLWAAWLTVMPFVFAAESRMVRGSYSGSSPASSQGCG